MNYTNLIKCGHFIPPFASTDSDFFFFNIDLFLTYWDKNL